MARTIAASILSKLSDEVVYPFYAVDLNFDTNPVYAWTGIGTITIAGNDYINFPVLSRMRNHLFSMRKW